MEITPENTIPDPSPWAGYPPCETNEERRAVVALLHQELERPKAKGELCNYFDGRTLRKLELKGRIVTLSKRFNQRRHFIGYLKWFNQREWHLKNPHLAILQGDEEKTEESPRGGNPTLPALGQVL